jgi:hypothetical protein
MLDRLAEKSAGAVPSVSASGEFGPPTSLVVGDFTHRRVALRWDAVGGAIGYHLYRSTASGGPYGAAQRLNARLVESPMFVDTSVQSRAQYFYVVRAVSQSTRESGDSVEVGVRTATKPPPCEPFFSLRQGRPVTRTNTPTEAVCP